MTTLKDVETAYHTAEKVQETYRREQCASMLTQMKNQDERGIFKEWCAKLKITNVWFYKSVTSPDYMPDMGWIMFFATKEDNERVAICYESTDEYEPHRILEGEVVEDAEDMVQELNDIEWTGEHNIICDAEYLWEYIVKYASQVRELELYDE